MDTQDEYSPEETVRRARELAHRLLTTPWKPRLTKKQERAQAESDSTAQPRDKLGDKCVRHVDMNLGSAALSDHNHATLFRSCDIFDSVKSHEPACWRTLKQFSLNHSRLPGHHDDP